MICIICKQEKDISEMSKSKRYKSGYETRCKSCKYAYNQIYRNKNKEKLSEKWKLRIYTYDQRKRYAESYKEQRNEKRKLKRQTDPLYRLTENIRNNISSSFKSNKEIKNKRTLDILGCSYEDFKKYIEYKFESWMTWENYGLYNGELNYGWDIDHIIPISSAQTEEEIVKLNHYTNLQPLCSRVNRDIKKDYYL